MARIDQIPGRRQSAFPKRDILLALGIALYPSTEFREYGSPVGPGEVLIFLWIASSFFLRAFRPRVAPGRAALKIAWFWVALGFAEAVGMIVGLSTERFQDWGGIRNDIGAFLLMASLSLVLAFGLTDEPRRRRLVWMTVVFGSVSHFLQLLHGAGIGGPPGIDPWYYNRFRGWSDNANQLAFFACFTTLMCLYLADKAKKTFEIVMVGIWVLPVVVVGILTDSDSYWLGLIPALFVYSFIKAITFLPGGKSASAARSAMVAMSVFLLPVAAAGALLVVSPFEHRLVKFSANLYAKSDQGDTRLNLWKEGLEKGTDAYMLGLGPGPHLTSKSYKRPPPSKFEVHNVLIDLYTQGGALAVAAFVWLCATILAGCWRYRLAAPAALVIGMMIFTTFHFFIRHPVLWFAFAICLLEIDTARLGRRQSFRPQFSPRHGHAQ